MKDSNFEPRIGRLERQLRFQRWTIGGLLIAVLTIVGIGASSSDVANELKAAGYVVDANRLLSL